MPPPPSCSCSGSYCSQAREGRERADEGRDRAGHDYQGDLGGGGQVRHQRHGLLLRRDKVCPAIYVRCCGATLFLANHGSVVPCRWRGVAAVRFGDLQCDVCFFSQ